MPEAVLMPKLGFDMAEGTLVNWIKKVGDSINRGEVIAEIETDKATIEIESNVSGTILQLLAQPGDALPVGATIAYVGQPGEQPSGAPATAPAPAAAPATEAPTPAQPAVPARVPSGNGEGYPGGVKASPLARRIAAEKGIDLRQVQGSGPGGRIVREDVEKFAPIPAAAPAPRPAAALTAIPAPSLGAAPEGPDVEVIDLSKLRQRIGVRMVESKQQVPHFYVTTEIDVDALLALRQQLNDGLDETQKISVNDLVVKAAALTLRQFPNLNTHFYGDKLVRHKRINIGIAVALPQGGLMNVVCHDADKVSLGTMAVENREKVARAREGKVRPDDVEGSTFTVSNLGPYDVDFFAAIINPPEAGILAVGSAQKVPVVKADGTLGVGQRMKVTISVDHRVSDGAEAAAFMKALKQLLENPMRLLI